MWPRIANAALGLWLMAAPAVLGYGDPAAANDRIVGPIAAGFATIAACGATRPVRWVNLALGAWLLLAPWLLGYDDAAPRLNSMAVGIGLAAFAAVRGEVRDRFGGGWSALWRSDETNHDGPTGGTV